jgi:hypothetical protein
LILFVLSWFATLLTVYHVRDPGAIHMVRQVDNTAILIGFCRSRDPVLVATAGNHVPCDRGGEGHPHRSSQHPRRCLLRRLWPTVRSTRTHGDAAVGASHVACAPLGEAPSSASGRE